VSLIVGGGLQVALAGWLVGAMREEHFAPTPRGDRSTWGHLWSTTRAGAREIADQRALVWLAVVFVVAGGASEAYDRLTERRFLVDVGFPKALHGSSLTWFTVIFLVSASTGIVVPMLVERAAPARDRRRLGRWMVGLYLGQVAAIALFGLTLGFVAAGAAVVVVDRTRSVRDSLTTAWIIPLTTPERRATVLSSIGQFDAFGQMLIGPAFGLVASRAGVGPALVASALVMAPGVVPLAAAGRVAPRARS
jgi:DHA3 family tetracycline resistance protein-like MFS transporter